jgi:phosphoenolpyruvate carboxylase
MTAEELRDVGRAFAQFMALSNCAETHHRISRLEVMRQGGALPMDKVDSCGGAMEAALNIDGKTPAEVMQALQNQAVEIVLTAHPTEVHRRTTLVKLNRVEELLGQREACSADAFELAAKDASLRRQISSMWGQDEIRRAKPTPVVEAKNGLVVLETVLWDAVPGFLRRLDAAAEQHLGEKLPLHCSPIKFASWMGGDRDGNPNVTAAVTREVCTSQRLRAAELLLPELEHLGIELSVTDATPEFMAKVAALPESYRHAGDNFTSAPYRCMMSYLHDRVESTAAWAEARLGGGAHAVNPDAPPIFDASELKAELLAVHASLQACNYGDLADGGLTDLVRRVACFGLTLARLDVRQESTRHSMAMAEITKMCGLGDYMLWSETQRLTFLSQELGNPRPLLPRKSFDNLRSLGFPADVVDVLETFDVVSDPNMEGSLGAYVISHAKSASDVLAVMLLQHEAGVERPLRVVPLFETLQDLQNAPAIVDSLFGVPGYIERIGGEQEIMVGYSDSAKDAGRIAAAWAQYESQEKMLQVAQKHGVQLTFFHGKGGTVGRGGNPAVYQAIMSHPPGTIDGRFRITEQGEMITQNFGSQVRSTLDSARSLTHSHDTLTGCTAHGRAQPRHLHRGRAAGPLHRPAAPDRHLATQDGRAVQRLVRRVPQGGARGPPLRPLLPQGHPGDGAGRPQRRQPACQAQPEGRGGVAARHPLDLCLVADAPQPAGLAGGRGGAQAEHRGRHRAAPLHVQGVAVVQDHRLHGGDGAGKVRATDRRAVRRHAP